MPFSHPDSTVGPGIAPGLPGTTGLRPLSRKLAGFTADQGIGLRLTLP